MTATTNYSNEERYSLLMSGLSEEDIDPIDPSDWTDPFAWTDEDIERFAETERSKHLKPAPIAELETELPAVEKPKKGTEHYIQVELFRWLARHPDSRSGMAFTISNGARTGWTTSKKLKAEGVRPGVPDIMIAAPSGGQNGTKLFNGLFIELKRPRSKKNKPVVSPEQQRWINALREHGYQAEVCYGLEEAQAAINNYLALSPLEPV
jgi:VRR-NUC domain